MAWSVVKKNAVGKVPTWRSFICDLISDVATLPVAVAPGSECYCSENGATYVLEIDGDWVVKGSSKGGVSISSLNDTTITSPANGDVLSYDAESEKWVNSVLPIFFVKFAYDEGTSTASCDKTYAQISAADEAGLVLLGVSDWGVGLLLNNASEYMLQTQVITDNTLANNSFVIDNTNAVSLTVLNYTLTPAE